MTDFLDNENRLRVGRYAKPSEDERFLVALNRRLAELDRSLISPSAQDMPNIFVFGLPRSGSTLLYQYLAHALDVAWPTNLMARFWEAPLVGMRLSRILGLFEQPLNLVSDYGLTPKAEGPHEFGYFWMKWFVYPDVCLKGTDEQRHLDMDGLKRTLDGILQVAERPVVYKNLIPAFHLDRFRPIQPRSLFLYVVRNPADIAVSFLTARLRRYGDDRICWSFRPADYTEKARSMSSHEQVTYQLSALSERLSSQACLLDPQDALPVPYESLCRKPNAVVARVAAWLEERGCSVQVRRRLSETTPITHKQHPLYGVFNEALSHADSLPHV